jgi:hypothetical protein
VVVPRGFTKIEAGDVLTLITTRQHQRALRGWVGERAGEEEARPPPKLAAHALVGPREGGPGGQGDACTRCCRTRGSAFA